MINSIKNSFQLLDNASIERSQKVLDKILNHRENNPKARREKGELLSVNKFIQHYSNQAKDDRIPPEKYHTLTIEHSKLVK